MAKLKVLMLTHYFEQHRGGIEIVANAVARGLRSSGFDLRWLATDNSGADEVGTEDWRRVLAASNICESLLKVPYPLLYPSAWRLLWTEAKAADVVLIHDAIYMIAILGWLAARAHRKPVVVVQHIGAIPYQNPALRLLMALATRLITIPILCRADRVAFISHLTANIFGSVKLRHAPALIFNGVDTQVFCPPADRADIAKARAGLNLPPDVTVALFVGRFVEKKGLTILERMARAYPEVLFVFAGWGSIDPADWRLPNVLVYRSLSGSSLAPLYRASDVLLLPSVGEGFPLVVQEALACGLPVVCGMDTAQADPAATSFLSGVSVDLKEPERTARLLASETFRLLRETGSMADRHARGMFAKTRYSWDSAVAAYGTLLQEVSSQRCAGKVLEKAA